MRRSAILALALLAAFAVQGQTRRRAVPSNPEVPLPSAYAVPTLDGPWLVEITTSGGFGGSGAQRDIRVESNGTLTVGAIAFKGRTCQFHLTQEQLLEAFHAVLNARADLWFASYLPANDSSRCCDLLYTDIRMERQERDPNGNISHPRYLTELIPSLNQPNIPLDLIGLYNAIESNFDKYNDQ